MTPPQEPGQFRPTPPDITPEMHPEMTPKKTHEVTNEISEVLPLLVCPNGEWPGLKLPFKIWAVPETTLAMHGTTNVVTALAHPELLTAVIPIADNMLNIANQVLYQYVRENATEHNTTSVARAGDTIERVSSLGDSDAKVLIYIGDALKRQNAPGPGDIAAALLLHEIRKAAQQRAGIF